MGTEVVKLQMEHSMNVADILALLDGGSTPAKLMDELEKVARAVVVAPEKTKGTLTLQLTVEKLAHGQIIVRDKITSKLPDVQVEPATFFVTAEGSLSRRDPSQLSLLKELERNDA